MSDQPTPPETPGETPPASDSEATPKAAEPATPAEAAPETPAVEKPAPAAEAPAAPKPAAPPKVSAAKPAAPVSGPAKSAPAAAAKSAATGKTYTWGTGRRKAAVARVRIRRGSGKFLIRGREIDDYFMDIGHRNTVQAPLKATDTHGKYDILVNVHGGGQTGQAGAIVLGLARALLLEDPSFEDSLRHGRYLTRDARKVERKKPGQPGARKRFQFSKR